MVKLRLKRFGKKGQPHYRIVATKSRTKRDGMALEDLGHYSPISKIISLNEERINYWIQNGAQPTETVQRLLVKNKLAKAPKYKKVFKHEPGEKSKERTAKKLEKKTAKETVVEEEAKAAE